MPRVPIPQDTMRPGLEGTGPAIDLGMAMGALNTGAASWMWDWEDAGGDYKDQLYQAWENLRDLLAHQWVGKPFVHPTKKQGGKPREYTIDLPPEQWPTIFHRVPGPPSAEPADLARWRAGAGDHPRARHARGEQLRHAEAERLGRLLLRAEDRDVAGSAAGRQPAEEGRGGARACRAGRSRSRCSTSAPNTRCSRKPSCGCCARTSSARTSGDGII